MKRTSIAFTCLAVIVCLGLVAQSLVAYAQEGPTGPIRVFIPFIHQVDSPKAPLQCSELLVNGNFEGTNGWDIPVTAWTAGYSTQVALSPSHSMRTGITNTADNRFSYSDARQLVTIPSGVTSATFHLSINPFSSEPTSAPLPSTQEGTLFGQAKLTGDVQYVIILDQFQVWIDTLYWSRSNSQSWTGLTFDLTRFAGRTINLQFGSYNDGANGITSMFVDDASLSVCSTQVGTGTPTATPTATATPLPPGTCSEGLKNTGFESNSDWGIPITEYTAGYSTARAHAGVQSMRTGITVSTDNRFSYSDAFQVVTIPSNISSAVLSLWYYPSTTESTLASLPATHEGTKFGTESLQSDVQYVLVLDQFGNWIGTLLWTRSNAQAWTHFSIDLKAYAGKTIRLQFGTFNTGSGGITSMFVDDMTLTLCPLAATATPTLTPTPTATFTPTPTLTPTAIPSSTPLPSGCSQLIKNTGFETNSDWDVPITEYTAGYSTAKAHTGVQSMRTGITVSADNRFSYSDAWQAVTIPSNIRNATLQVWFYPTTTEPVATTLEKPKVGTQFSQFKALTQPSLSGDVQYLLILDNSGTIINVLLWQRLNNQAWLTYNFDLTIYKGQTIRVQFGTFNDGFNGLTSMYADDILLTVCP